jgi:hypothetical protein
VADHKRRHIVLPPTLLPAEATTLRRCERGGRAKLSSTRVSSDTAQTVRARTSSMPCRAALPARSGRPRRCPEGLRVTIRRSNTDQEGVGGVARSAVARSPDVKDWLAVAVCNRPWGVAVQDDGDVSQHKSVDVLGGLRARCRGVSRSRRGRASLKNEAASAYWSNQSSVNFVAAQNCYSRQESGSRARRRRMLRLTAEPSARASREAAPARS